LLNYCQSEITACVEPIKHAEVIFYFDFYDNETKKNIQEGIGSAFEKLKQHIFKKKNEKRKNREMLGPSRK